MKFIRPSFEILDFPVDMNRKIEQAARTCYKSEDCASEQSADTMVKMLLHRNHLAMIEHGGTISVKLTVDRGITHELVRSRLFSFAQESTRYCNYAKDKFDGEVTFIVPSHFTDEQFQLLLKYNDNSNAEQLTGDDYGSDVFLWLSSLHNAEDTYMYLLNEKGWTPQQARSVLPNALKSDIVMSANPRSWIYFFSLRDDKNAHPDMQVIARAIHEDFARRNPILFDGGLNVQE